MCVWFFIEVTSSVKHITKVQKDNAQFEELKSLFHVPCRVCNIIFLFSNLSFYDIIVSKRRAIGKLIYDIDFKTTLHTKQKLISCEEY